jgi:hypothetical protein
MQAGFGPDVAADDRHSDMEQSREANRDPTARINWIAFSTGALRRGICRPLPDLGRRIVDDCPTIIVDFVRCGVFTFED